MKVALDRVKRALTVSNLAPQLAYINVHNGWMSASDGRLYASSPTEVTENFLVPGKELERALNFGDDMRLEKRPDHVLFMRGRTRIKLKTLDPESHFHSVQPPTDWAPFPPSFLKALNKVRPFISDNATQSWAMGAICMDGAVASTNNIVLAIADCARVPFGGIIPFWLIDFVNEMKEMPVQCASTAQAIFLRFSDGTWLRSLRIDAEAPMQMLAYITQVQQRDRNIWEIPDEWRTVYNHTLAFSEREVIVSPRQIMARSSSAEVVTEIVTPVEADTLWDNKYLGPVLRAATHWNIADYPKPCFWYGQGITGLVAGKTQTSR